MNPMTNIKNTQKISEREIQLGTVGTKNSWHSRYKDSAWIFIGGLPYDLTEGDVICVFSQCGEIVNCNMVRDQKTGKSKGFMFLCYEDQRSTILAVDNLNGIKLLNRTIRVDHVLDYKPPKDHDDDHNLTKHLKQHGCAPQVQSDSEDSDEIIDSYQTTKEKKKERKLKKKHKKEKKKSKRKSRSRSRSSSDVETKRVKTGVVVKKEKFDPGYGDVDYDNHHGDRRHRDGSHGNTDGRDDENGNDSRYNRRSDQRHSGGHQSSPKRRRFDVTKSPTRRRSRSPKRRSPSPRRRSRSPKRRSPSPRPKRRSPSPRRRSRSPKRRSPSPRRRSPRKRSRSPRARSRDRSHDRFSRR